MKDLEHHLGHRLTIKYSGNHAVLLCKDDGEVIKREWSIYKKKSSGCCDTCKMVFEEIPSEE